MGDEPTVALVDDKNEIVNVYASWLENGLWLGRDVDVRTAHGGKEALEVIDSHVDVVLLDRMMPDLSGGKVLEQLRSRGYGGRVVMLTALKPEPHISDMGFDDYLVKPVYRDDLSVVVNRMLDRDDYRDETVQEYFAEASKLAALDEYAAETDRMDSDEYQRLVRRVRELEEAVSGEVRRDHREFRAMLYDLSERT